MPTQEGATSVSILDKRNGMLTNLGFSCDCCYLGFFDGLSLLLSIL